MSETRLGLLQDHVPGEGFLSPSREGRRPEGFSLSDPGSTCYGHLDGPGEMGFYLQRCPLLSVPSQAWRRLRQRKPHCAFSLLGPCKDPRLQPPWRGVSFWWSPCGCFSYHMRTESRKLQGPWPRGGRRVTKGSPSFSEGHENRVILQQMHHSSANAGADVASHLSPGWPEWPCGN